MKKRIRTAVGLLGILLAGVVTTFPLPGQSLRIGQVDPGRLLTQQEVDLYLGITDALGAVPEELTPEQLRVEESADGRKFTEVPLSDLRPVAQLEGAITFLLLVDNSGSMYQTLAGRETEDPNQMRITAAKNAIRDFLAQIDSSRDRVALASFNTNYRVHAAATSSPEEIELALEEIRRPSREEAYTELYRAISLAAEDLEDTAGRKVIVVLSDGEDFPFSIHEEQPHPLYGESLVTPEQAVEAVARQSAGAFAINFATRGDQGLRSIVTESGGLSFDAGDQEELASVYAEIRDRILDEYRLTYRPLVLPGRTRIVRVTYLAARTVSAERRYFTETILGEPGDAPWILFLIPLLAAVALAGATALLRFRNNRTAPNLEVLNARGKATQVLDITSQKTVIGSSREADLTLANAPSLKESHATILYDKSTKSYTVVSDEPISVNNQRTSKRRLEPGDVIKLPGSTIVFDTPQEEKP